MYIFALYHLKIDVMKKLILPLLLLPLIVLTSCKSKDSDPEPAPEPVAPTLQVDNTVAMDADHRVIYEMNLYNFTSQGTLAAAQPRLQELRTLGIDIVWLMPIQTRSAKEKIGSLGSPYALKNYMELNKDHGTNADFKNFVNEAHRLGMEVWLDWVPNHTGLDNVWVTEHADYFETVDGHMVHPSIGGMTYNDVWQLDYNNADMRSAMIEAMKYWITEFGIDGYRIDFISSPKIPVTFWSEAIPQLKQAAGNKQFWMLGEADFVDKKGLYQEDFNYDYTVGFREKVVQQVGKGTSASVLKPLCRELVNNSNYKTLDRMIYLTNHDDINDNKNYFGLLGDNVPLMTVMEFTLYGMPLLYNGQEIGYKAVQDYFNRAPIKWTSVNTKIKNTIRVLVALRHTQAALGSGIEANRPSVKFLSNSKNSDVLTYEKKKGDNTVVVALNLGKAAVDVTISGIEEGEYNMVLNSETVESDVTTITPLTLSATTPVSIGAKGYVVLIKK